MKDTSINDKELFESVYTHARKELDASRGSHDWEHTGRVYALSIRIAEREGADTRIVGLAALLHDIARKQEDVTGGGICHAAEGARMAVKILEGLGLDGETVRKIAHCIESHRFRGDTEPVTLEAKVLFDADKLDSIGAVGIGRAFLFAGEVGARLHNKGVDIEKTEPYTVEDTAYREYYVKLRHVKDRMLTSEGKRLAGERHDYMVAFFERLDAETDGAL